MRGLVFACAFLLLTATAASAFVMIDHWFVPDNAFADSQMDTLAQFDLEELPDENDIKVTFVIPELDVRASKGPYRPEELRYHSVARSFWLPEDAEAGEYVVRMTIRDDDGNARVVHRFVEIE